MPRTRLTAKQQAFADFHEDIGNKETFGNGYESAKQAGYKGNDNTLRAIASENLTKLAIIAYVDDKRLKRQEKGEHNYDAAMLKLSKLAGYLKKLVKTGNIQAVTAALAIIREESEISGLHKNRFVDETEDKVSMTEREKSEAKRIASIRLKQGA